MTKSMKAVKDRKTDNRRISENMEKAFKKMAQVFGYPNMPLRNLAYVACVYMAYVFGDNLYGRKLIKIPEPRFVVFYNGTDKMPEQSVLRLSDAYESKSEELDLELRIRFININPGYNEEMVEKSPTLYQYVKFVDAVRKYQQQIPFPEAVEKAIDECIKKGILAEFLRKNRAEVLRVSIFEYDEEEHMRQEREESRQEGIEQVNDLYDKLHDLNREEDIWKAIKDVEYRKKLLKEFHLD